jgi:hypothetical protein
MSTDIQTTAAAQVTGEKNSCFDAIMDEGTLLGLANCCRQTVRSHVAHNPMMVCPTCKLMIKCFADEKSYNNYVTFCKSRGRRIKTEIDRGFYFVMYNSYPGAGN